jgi:hypothetical protein
MSVTVEIATEATPELVEAMGRLLPQLSRSAAVGGGEALNRFALDLAAQHGSRTVDLTSRPSREAANRLYRRLGFEARETNVYRYSADH